MIRKDGRRRGTSLLEMMISVSLLAIVMGMVIPAMIYYARVSKSVRMQQRMQQEVTLFAQEMNMAMARVFEVNFSNQRVINFGFHQSEFIADATQPTGWRFSSNTVATTLVYRDEDDDPATIGDNSLVIIQITTNEAGDEVSKREETLVRYLSPLEDADGNALPIFQRMTDGKRAYVMFQARLGDRVLSRKNLSAEERYKVYADDALTGPGYQGLVLQYMFVPHQRIVG